MTSINNWLGFSSLSPQLENHSQNSPVSQLGLDHEISACADQCFDTTNNINIIPSLNFPPFSIFEAFNTSTTTAHSQDWSMKDMGAQNDEETPKLENFLGQTFVENNEEENKLHHMSQSCFQPYTCVGLSMIKNWQRNNPSAPPPHAADNKVGGEAAAPPGNAQSLSLSMSTGLLQSSDSKLQSTAAESNIESVPRKCVDTFGQRTSIYRGVTRHRWTGRYEAHLWDNSCKREGQTRKGRQGGYDKEEKAARAYDLAALKYWGTTTTTNFPISNYEKEMEEMKHMTRQEYIASLRRKSSGFSRGASIYRGVTSHHQHGRWQARIGRVAGNKDLYLGTFSTQEEAAEAYDIAAIKFRGLSAVTNFEISRYEVKSILESPTLPIGGAAKRLKDAQNAEMALQMHLANESSNLSLHLTDIHNGYGNLPTIAFHQSQMSPFVHQRMWMKQEQDLDIGDIHHQLQVGNTQNHLMHNMMSLQSDQSSNSNFVVHGNYGEENGMNESNFMVPMMGNNDEEKPYGYEGLFGSSDGRNLYYQSHKVSLSNGIAKSGVFNDQGSTCNNWISSGVPTLAAGPSTFTVWNET
ncbi:hypothetical protein CDL12_05661 [Handroanthus impetiginosus]|uniref:AP2/ERF domain-containing protein n=1 Tax=Handroanthus impetiginosus TaxID=429701 RepID=A0A2G9HVS9_9LAMI|nr:hypothetical protein CDL12_05661 [Handroanthus impetiginosus]